MISVICCYNNEKIFNEVCKSSVEMQKNIAFEFIAIDNTRNVFKSAAKALNHAMNLVQYDYVVCVHQDFGFVNDNALRDIFDYLSKQSAFCVVGCAGAVYDASSKLVDRIIGRNRIVVSYLTSAKSTNDKDVVEVESIDECFFAFNKKLWEKHNFNEKDCFAWDLYSVEMCLYARKQGGKCYVIPIKGIHHSNGSLTSKIYYSVYLISKKYKKEFKYIVTTCVVFKTGFFDVCNMIWLILVNYIRKIKSCIEENG